MNLFVDMRGELIIHVWESNSSIKVDILILLTFEDIQDTKNGAWYYYMIMEVNFE